MIEDPYISRADLANYVGISETSIYRNIEAMRGKYLRRVGPDKGGFWEIIEDFSICFSEHLTGHPINLFVLNPEIALRNPHMGIVINSKSQQ